MDEKISNLIKNLHDACVENEIPLSACIFDETGRTIVAQYGENSQVEDALAEQIKRYERSLQECGCNDCIERLAGMNAFDAPSHTHTFVVNGKGDLKDVLKRIAEGDF